MKQYQKRVYENKVKHGFNVTNVETEFLLLYGEVSEAFNAFKKNENIGEELADVAIYLFGISEILGVDLETEMLKKMKINENRVYKSNGTKYLIKESKELDG
ncbi:hypothetical protein BW731_06940 [Vagococcus martis]|uniref:NTP pyrophosphohydrolase MazG putative catalytic core domain-containing protein n=1 Tax=Vagococcus martis TaxID=1768210 RepID=A0A1V4DHI7_9ENTE|nr:MazG-like family protein [Vagococcus martis]OPF87922.1 hypothetical protein BW731_06940 [Vagococcus martis]